MKTSFPKSILLFLFVIHFSGCPAPPAAKVPRANTDMMNLANGIQAYRTEFGAFPTGSEADILSALQGTNPRKLVFLEVSSSDIETSGRYLDPWHTPYSITFTSPSVVTITSAGPDRVPASSDDISVTK
jgi:hypothetical protein